MIENLSENAMEAFSKATLTTNAASGATTTYLGLTSESVHIVIAVLGLGLSVATFCVHLYFQKKRLELEKKRGEKN
jgi:hypothetical protein